MDKARPDLEDRGANVISQIIDTVVCIKKGCKPATLGSEQSANKEGSRRKPDFVECWLDHAAF